MGGFQRMKALCRRCHDGYSDENFCFGRCCGMDMVEVPESLYRPIAHNSVAVNSLIADKGKSLLGGN